MQGHRRDGCGAWTLDLRRRFVDHLDIQIGCSEMDGAFIAFDQHICQNRNGVAAFNNRLSLRQRSEQYTAFNAQFHINCSCFSNRLAAQGRAVPNDYLLIDAKAKPVKSNPVIFAAARR